MRRRELLYLAGIGLVGCSVPESDPDPDPVPDPDAAADPASDAAPDPGPDACTGESVLMHDTHAQALYLDGTYGPLTGIIRVDDVIAGVTITLDFWHGHGGQQHRFTLGAAELESLKAGQKTYVTTTEVDGHMHTLFIDPLDEAYRVDGAPDVPVPLGC
jgi:hypothetical protein